MVSVVRSALTTLCCVFLLSCGGGKSSTSPPIDPELLLLTPSRIDTAVNVGESRQLNVKVVPAADLDGPLYLLVIDEQGVIQPTIEVRDQYDGTFLATLTTAELAVGEHVGELMIHLCADEVCREEYDGSPIRLPYRLAVPDPVNLSTLSRLPGGEAWRTYQGNNAHTAYVPVTLDATRFNPRWRLTTASMLSAPVIANGLIYVAQSRLVAGNPQRALNALSETDGSIVWQHVYPRGTSITESEMKLGPPAVYGDQVLEVFSRTEHDGSTAWQDAGLYRFDAATGDALGSAAVYTQSGGDAFGTPVADDDKVYLISHDGILAYSLTGDAFLWESNIGTWGNRSLTVDMNHIYNFEDGLVVIPKSDGYVHTPHGIISPPEGAGPSDAPAIIAGDNNVIGVTAGRLISFNPGTESINWNVSGNYHFIAAVANGVLYAATTRRFDFATNAMVDARLEARSITDGRLLWTWTLPDSSSPWANLVVTNNVLFIGTLSPYFGPKTYAVSLTGNHATLWSHHNAGSMALSEQGVLYINDTGGGLTAINLQ